MGLVACSWRTACGLFQAEQRAFNSQPANHATKRTNNYRPDTEKHGTDCCSNGRADQDATAVLTPAATALPIALPSNVTESRCVGSKSLSSKGISLTTLASASTGSTM